MIELSIVIAVKNEAKNLLEFESRLTTSISKLNLTYEIIFVTDINVDNTLSILKSINKRDKKVKIIKLSNSFGQYVALMAGLKYASGDSVITMDGDLQDFPEDIVKLFNEYKKGYDIVYGIKEEKDDTKLRNFFSKYFIFLLNKFSDIKLKYNTNIFRVMSRRTVDEILKFREKEPSITGITNLIGFPTAKVLVKSGKRVRGESNYSYKGLFNLAISTLLSFSTKPIRIISIIGLTISFFSFVYLVFIIIGSIISGSDVAGYPTIVSLILLIGGVQLFAIGIIGEYIGRIFIETKNRPLYIIEQLIGDFK